MLRSMFQEEGEAGWQSRVHIMLETSIMHPRVDVKEMIEYKTPKFLGEVKTGYVDVIVVSM